MNVESISTQSLVNVMRSTLPGINTGQSIDVSGIAAHLHMGEVHVHEDVYAMVVGHLPSRSGIPPEHRNALISLLVDALPHMKVDGIGYFKHWVDRSNRIEAQAPMLYRFAIFESSRTNSWLITESLL